MSDKTKVKYIKINTFNLPKKTIAKIDDIFSLGISFKTLNILKSYIHDKSPTEIQNILDYINEYVNVKNNILGENVKVKSEYKNYSKLTLKREIEDGEKTFALVKKFIEREREYLLTESITNFDKSLKHFNWEDPNNKTKLNSKSELKLYENKFMRQITQDNMIRSANSINKIKGLTQKFNSENTEKRKELDAYFNQKLDSEPKVYVNLSNRIKFYDELKMKDLKKSPMFDRTIKPIRISNYIGEPINSTESEDVFDRTSENNKIDINLEIKDSNEQKIEKLEKEVHELKVVVSKLSSNFGFEYEINELKNEIVEELKN